MFKVAGDSLARTEVNATFAPACAQPAVMGRLEAAPPAGLLGAPELRSKPLLKAGTVKII